MGGIESLELRCAAGGGSRATRASKRGGHAPRRRASFTSGLRVAHSRDVRSGASQPRATTGSGEFVQRQTTSAPRTASSKLAATTAPWAAAASSAWSRVRLATRISRKLRGTTSRCARPCTPAPRTASTDESSRANARGERRRGGRANRRDVGPVHDGERPAVLCIEERHKRLVRREPALVVAREHGHELRGECPIDVRGHRSEEAVRSDRSDPRRHRSLPGADRDERALQRNQEHVDVERRFHLCATKDQPARGTRRGGTGARARTAPARARGARGRLLDPGT